MCNRGDANFSLLLLSKDPALFSDRGECRLSPFRSQKGPYTPIYLCVLGCQRTPCGIPLFFLLPLFTYPSSAFRHITCFQPLWCYPLRCAPLCTLYVHRKSSEWRCVQSFQAFRPLEALQKMLKEMEFIITTHARCQSNTTSIPYFKCLMLSISSILLCGPPHPFYTLSNSLSNPCILYSLWPQWLFQ